MSKQLKTVRKNAVTQIVPAKIVTAAVTALARIVSKH